MGPTPFYGARAEKNQKADFAMKQTNIGLCRLSGDIITIRRRTAHERPWDFFQEGVRASGRMPR